MCIPLSYGGLMALHKLDCYCLCVLYYYCFVYVSKTWFTSIEKWCLFLWHVLVMRHCLTMELMLQLTSVSSWLRQSHKLPTCRGDCCRFSVEAKLYSHLWLSCTVISALEMRMGVSPYLRHSHTFASVTNQRHLVNVFWSLLKRSCITWPMLVLKYRFDILSYCDISVRYCMGRGLKVLLMPVCSFTICFCYNQFSVIIIFINNHCRHETGYFVYLRVCFMRIERQPGQDYSKQKQHAFLLYWTGIC